MFLLIKHAYIFITILTLTFYFIFYLLF